MVAMTSTLTRIAHAINVAHAIAGPKTETARSEDRAVDNFVERSRR
jgi:hypothetical protein